MNIRTITFVYFQKGEVAILLLNC